MAIEAIGNRARTEILHRLVTSPTTGPELARAMGVKRESVYRHLAALEDAGLVGCDRPAGQRHGHAVTWNVVPERVIQVAEEWAVYAGAHQHSHPLLRGEAHSSEVPSEVGTKPRETGADPTRRDAEYLEGG